MEETYDAHVRQATLADWEQIISVDESTIGSSTRSEKIRLGIENCLVYVCAIGTEIAAFALLNYHFFDRPFLELLIVKPEYRRKGLGKMLLSALQRQVCGERLFTSTNASNEPMQRLLADCGFQRCGWIDQLDENDPEIVYCYTSKATVVKQCQTVKGVDPIQIMPLSWERLGDIYTTNEPFLVTGRVKATFVDGQWIWTEEILSTPYEKSYPDEQLDYSLYINNPERAVFLAYRGKECVGRIRIAKNWNQYGLVEDISVAKDYRGRGVGKRLMDAAKQWAKEGGLPGLVLETQDTNPAACRFYERYGFQLGGVDVMLYGNSVYKHEQALFWYLRF